MAANLKRTARIVSLLILLPIFLMLTASTPTPSPQFVTRLKLKTGGSLVLLGHKVKRTANGLSVDGKMVWKNEDEDGMEYYFLDEIIQVNLDDHYVLFAEFRFGVSCQCRQPVLLIVYSNRVETAVIEGGCNGIDMNSIRRQHDGTITFTALPSADNARNEDIRCVLRNGKVEVTVTYPTVMETQPFPGAGIYLRMFRCHWGGRGDEDRMEWSYTSEREDYETLKKAGLPIWWGCGDDSSSTVELCGTTAGYAYVGPFHNMTQARAAVKKIVKLLPESCLLILTAWQIDGERKKKEIESIQVPAGN